MSELVSITEVAVGNQSRHYDLNRKTDCRQTSLIAHKKQNASP
jgi:hypothetical protein